MAFLKAHVLIVILVLAGAATFLWLLQFRSRLRMTGGGAGAFDSARPFGVFCVAHLCPL